jgi:hypothetical protein
MTHRAVKCKRDQAKSMLRADELRRQRYGHTRQILKGEKPGDLPVQERRRAPAARSADTSRNTPHPRTASRGASVLLVERDDRNRIYKPNTVFDVAQAYFSARLITRPDREWFNP